MRGCPIRYASGSDRPCRAHKAEDGVAELDARAWSLARVRLPGNRRWPQIAPPEPGELDDGGD